MASDAAEFVPDTRELSALARAVRDCRGCELHANATQAVFGSGPVRARVMAVGEQPGDREDVEGEPFVGPAGRNWTAPSWTADSTARTCT
ncbi:uracil-DNA glycosylase, family 4 [Prauserella aidingensis]|nr:uracil-DNA glycosylase, family 4 [Prauserella aidingensis]